MLSTSPCKALRSDSMRCRSCHAFCKCFHPAFRESVWTQRFSVRAARCALTRVGTKMSGEGVPPATGVAAQMTLEGLLSWVEFDVTQQVALLGERRTTLAALEWTFSWGQHETQSRCTLKQNATLVVCITDSLFLVFLSFLLICFWPLQRHPSSFSYGYKAEKLWKCGVTALHGCRVPEQAGWWSVWRAGGQREMQQPMGGFGCRVTLHLSMLPLPHRLLPLSSNKSLSDSACQLRNAPLPGSIWSENLIFSSSSSLK